MLAMMLHEPRTPLRAEELPMPKPGPEQLLLRVEACGVCRTDLHVVDGELPDPALPIVPGHEVVGTVAALGAGVERLRPGERGGGAGGALGAGVERLRQGERVGVPWLGYSCGTCGYCRAGRENLCERA